MIGWGESFIEGCLCQEWRDLMRVVLKDKNRMS